MGQLDELLAGIRGETEKLIDFFVQAGGMVPYPRNGVHIIIGSTVLEGRLPVHMMLLKET
jgi:hypothetical protein